MPLLLWRLRPNAHFVGVQATARLAVAHRHLISDSDEIGQNDLSAGRGRAGAHGDYFGVRIDRERLFERSAVPAEPEMTSVDPEIESTLPSERSPDIDSLPAEVNAPDV